MAYTVKQLAKLSGVSVRSLHWYDEIGLLKPTYQGTNGYRYYEEKECLRLQQILSFKTLGFPLNEIQKLLMQDDYDHIKALEAHKQVLENDINRKNQLIVTIDKTLSHLRGQHKMPIEEMFDGFDPIKQQEHEKYMLEMEVISQQQIDDSWQRVSHWKKPDWERFKDTGEKLHVALVEMLKQGQKVDSYQVQKLIQQHYDWVNNFWTPTQETYVGLGQMYLDHPDFRHFYNRFHPDLAEYIVEAMNVFAKNNLA